MVNDDDAIGCCMGVELDAICVKLEGTLERRERVLPAFTRCPAVGDELRRPRGTRRTQLTLSDFLGWIQLFSLKIPRRTSRSSAVGSCFARYSL